MGKVKEAQRYAVNITDSPYAVLHYFITNTIGQSVLDAIENPTHVVAPYVLFNFQLDLSGFCKVSTLLVLLSLMVKLTVNGPTTPKINSLRILPKKVSIL
jgi:hypothetical protein